MSSHVFLGPTPIIEKSSSPPLRLATALLETAAGMAGILGASAASIAAAQSARRRKPDSFFIDEILRLRIDDSKAKPRGTDEDASLPLEHISLDQPLADRMNEVCIGGRLAVRAHMAGNLSAMIRRVHQDVSQNILYAVCPRLAFAVLVGNRIGEVGRRKGLEVFSPQPPKLCHLGFALFNVELRPDGKTLWLLFQPFQPEPLGGKYVRQELQRPRVRIQVGSHCRQHFSVCPRFVDKLTTQIFQHLHTLFLSFSLADGILSGSRPFSNVLRVCLDRACRYSSPFHNSRLH